MINIRSIKLDKGLNPYMLLNGIKQINTVGCQCSFKRED